MKRFNLNFFSCNLVLPNLPLLFFPSPPILPRDTPQQNMELKSSVRLWGKKLLKASYVSYTIPCQLKNIHYEVTEDDAQIYK